MNIYNYQYNLYNLCACNNIDEDCALSIIKILSKHNINYYNDHDINPLLIALFNNNFKISEFLITNGAKLPLIIQKAIKKYYKNPIRVNYKNTKVLHQLNYNSCKIEL